MDAMDALRSSAPETKAERIARYKAERRRELAERYGAPDQFASEYVRGRERKIADSSETPAKEKEKWEDGGSEQTYAGRGPESQVDTKADCGMDKSTFPKRATPVTSETQVRPSVETSTDMR